MDLNKAPPSRVLFVKDIPQHISYDHFESLFKSLPGYLIMRRKPHFAFIEFKDREFATMAMIKFSGYKFNSSDKPLIIDYDKDRNKDMYGEQKVRDTKDNYSGYHNDYSNSGHGYSYDGDRGRDRGYSKDYNYSSSSSSRRKENDEDDIIKLIDNKDRTNSKSSSSSPPYSSSSSSPLSSSPLLSSHYQDRKRVRSSDDHHHYSRSSSSSSSSYYSSNDRYHNDSYNHNDSYRHSSSSSSSSSYLIPSSSTPLSPSNYQLPLPSSSHYHNGGALSIPTHPHPHPLPTSISTGIPCPTLFVSNLPKDVTERELSILFRFMRGFIGIRLINKEGKLPMCFCDFVDTPSSMCALDFLQGFRMDASDISSSISIEFDKANHKSRN
ncbi:hypothetical protein RB653_007350 [Dictyostelium firmibasis]|uniref:RRM domain-containing protein n=1 Tax=Dictyostelium firmibasis TaxID=79012 RepID=A0AAN7TNM3_9MYCE